MVVLLLAVALAARLWGQARLRRATALFEQEIGPLDRSQFLLPVLADEENAAVWLLAGGEAVVVPEESLAAWRGGRSVPLEQWTPEIHLAAAELIEENQPAIELLTRALPLERSSFGIRYDKGVDAETPPLIELWRASKLIRLDAQLALLEGDRARLGRDIALLDRVSSALTEESFLITALIALSTERLLIDTAYDVVWRFEGDPGLLMDLQTRVSALEPTELLRRDLAAEATLPATTPVEHLQPEEIGYLARQLTRQLEPFTVATLLEGYMDMWSLLPEPFVAIREYYFSKEGVPAWNIFGVLLPNLVNAIGKAKAIETGRLLALEALQRRLSCIESGEYPRSVELDVSEPFAGGSIVITPAENGGQNLEAPQAMELWSEVYGEDDHVESPPLSWHLPACDPQRPLAVTSMSADRELV